jgi:hypothetical protein
VAATARKRDTLTNELIGLRQSSGETGTKLVDQALTKGLRGRPSRVVLAPRRWR